MLQYENKGEGGGKMGKLRHFVVFVCVFALSLVIAGRAAQAVEKTGDGTVILKLAHVNPVGRP
ncbi:MAG: hypothetical protein ACETVN_05180 [Asgard group archaeon]